MTSVAQTAVDALICKAETIIDPKVGDSYLYEYVDMLKTIRKHLLDERGLQANARGLRMGSAVIRLGYTMRVMAIYNAIAGFASQYPAFNVLILGSGLDPLGRCVQMKFPSACRNVYEMDCEEVVALKRSLYEKAGWGVDCILGGCDFNDPEAVSVSLEEVADDGLPTLVVSEVVLSYVSDKEGCLTKVVEAFGRERTTLLAYETLLPNPTTRVLYQNAYEEKFQQKLSRGKVGGSGGGALKTWRDRGEIMKTMGKVFGPGVVTNVTSVAGKRIEVVLPDMFDEHAELSLYLSCYTLVHSRIKVGPWLVDWEGERVEK